MKKVVINTILASLIAVLGFAAYTVNAHDTYAEDGGEETSANETPKTSLTLMPVSKTLTISSNSSYDGSLSVSNDGSDDIKVEVHASPYSYVHSDETDAYTLGFNNQNNFTQISRWITIKDAEGNYVQNPTFTIKKGETLNVDYKVTTPNNIPAGGQYAVIFVQTVSSGTNTSGIRTEASAGMVLYGHSSEGEAVVAAEIRDMTIGQGPVTSEGAAGENSDAKNGFYGSAKVKNTGNLDFFARGVLKVEPIIGFSSYETTDNSGVVSIIPESERVVSDGWEDAPGFGIYKVTWTVTAGEETETISQVLFVNLGLMIFIVIIVLTIVVVSIIIGVKKRKERKSRLAI